MTDRSAFVTQVQRRAVRRVTLSVATHTVIIGAVFWLVYAVVAVVVPLLVHRAGNEMEFGVLVASDYIARWVGFGTAIAMIATILCTHLGAGGTRSTLRDGALRAAVVTGVFYAALSALATPGERSLFTALGWAWNRPADALTTGSWAVPVEFVADTFATTVYVLVGCAVVVGYQTHGVWRGTLLVVPGLVPLALVDLVTAGGSGHDLLGELVPVPGSSSVAVGLLGGAAVVALATAWLHLQLRNLRIRPTR